MPPDPSTQNQQAPSPEQEAQRLKFKEACDEWVSLNAEQKAEYATRAQAYNLAGFSLFMREKLNLPRG
jgi:hypothetical protein